MLRTDWKFQYNANQLADAAENKHNVHLSKLAWWEDKKKEVMRKVAESGIEIQDSVAASYSSTKGVFGPQIKIDSGLQRDLSECQEKILEHDRRAQEYKGWVECLRAQNGHVLELDHDDYLFFLSER